MAGEVMEIHKEMNLNNAQEITAKWMGTATSEEKLGFMKTLTATLTTEEINSLLVVLNHEKRRKKRKDPSLRKPKNSSEEEVSDLAKAVSGPTNFECNDESEVGWWTEWPKEKIVAMDCEYVRYNNATGLKGLDKIKAAKVSIVNWDLQVIYEESICHDPKNCEINAATIAINGITKATVRRGKQLDDVREAVRKILEDKLVIVCSGETDFSSLGLEMGSFETFYLQSHWLLKKVNSFGVTVIEKISLKRIAKKHLGVEFQKGVHSATEDANITMRIFRDVYPLEKKGELISKWNNDLYINFD